MRSHARLVALLLLSSAFAATAGDWPQWHGPTRDCVAAAGSPVPATLPKELKPLWKIAVGAGHSSPVVAGGRLVFCDENGKQEIAHCLDAKTGKELWNAAYAERTEDEWGAGPRATPLMDGDRVYVQSVSGELRCLSLKDGKALWGASFEKDFGVKFLGYKANSGTASRRGNNGTPVLDGDALVVPVGSTQGATLVCFDKLTGKVRWKAGDEEAAYSAPMVGTLAGVRQVVYLSATSLSGVDRASGKPLWRVPLKSAANRHVATPVLRGDTVTVNSHTLGTLCFKVAKDSAGLQATPQWAAKDLKTNLATPVLAGGHFYNQGERKDYVCFDAETGVVKWSKPGFGNGKRDYSSTIVVGNRLLVLSEAGELLLLAASAEKYTELGRLQVCGGTWSHPAYADGRLFVRDARELACVELAK